MKIEIRHVDKLFEHPDYCESVKVRLLNKYTESSTGCWEWNESVDKKGRAVVKVGLHRHKAARVMYVLHNKVKIGDLYVLHSCDNVLCINPEHLWLGTHEDTMKDMRDKGRSLVGVRNANSKFSDDDIRAVKKLLNEGALSLQDIASIYGTTKGVISHIKCGKTWKHI